MPSATPLAHARGSETPTLTSLLFLGAEAREFDGLLQYCTQVEAKPWPISWGRTAELNGRKIIMMANGAGPRSAKEALDAAMLSRVPFDAVVSTGFCGALDPRLAIGDVFAATELETGAGTFSLATPTSARPHFRGQLVSIDRVAQTAEEKGSLRNSGASAVEMEAAGVVRLVREWEVPLFCVRAVTDSAGESFAMDFNAVRLPDGRFSTPRILAAAMRRPHVLIPELVGLRNRCRRASRSLGEFLADCHF